MTRTLILLCILISTLAMMAILLKPPAAHAGDLDWNWDVDRYHAVRHRHRPVVRQYRSIEIVREDRDDWHCLDKVHVVGSQWIGEQGAEDSAKKAFMEEVRYRYGETFMDVDHARDYEHRCTRSSVGKVAGQIYYRCEVAARPCKAPMVKADGK